MSEELAARARRVIPGGVNSPVRAFGAVGGASVHPVRGEGAWIEDGDGTRYLDYVQSWGALLFGHAREEIVDAASRAAERGTSFGMPTEAEIRMAETLTRMVPSMDMVRLVSSGTEAAMSAIRLARGATGRARVVKFAGCYHGHSDALLAGAGSGIATFAIPGTPGVTAGAVMDTVVLPYNDLDAAAGAFDEAGEQIACVIVEPVAANMGVVPPEPGFLEGLRELTIRHGAALVFDEVITGFRLGPGGAQGFFGVDPDLTILGKVMGGGFPCAAFGGRVELMEELAPAGPVYQAGTLSGNPVAVAAGLAALDLVEREDPYPELEKAAGVLVEGLSGLLETREVPHAINRVGSLFSLFLGVDGVRDYAEAQEADHDAFGRLFREMLGRGVHLPPSGYEAWFLGTAHGAAETERTLEAAESVLEGWGG